jgi:hypothetical protein
MKLVMNGGKQYPSRLRHYAIIRIVADSIPDYVIGFSNWFNPSSRT